jgi:hypothetical protein
MPSEALKRDILKEVEKHDGQWYWYHLDRRLLGIHPGEGTAELMQAIKELASLGLIEIKPNEALDQHPRYWLTALGRGSISGSG